MLLVPDHSILDGEGEEKVDINALQEHPKLHFQTLNAFFDCFSMDIVVLELVSQHLSCTLQAAHLH